MGRTAGARRSTLTLQIKVKFNGIDNVAVDNCAGEAIPARIICKGWEEANMVVLANNDKRDGGPETQFLHASAGKWGLKYMRDINGGTILRMRGSSSSIIVANCLSETPPRI